MSSKRQKPLKLFTLLTRRNKFLQLNFQSPFFRLYRKQRIPAGIKA